MTFSKNMFEFSNGYLFYSFNGECKFVARLKWSRSPFTKAKIIKELVANHSPEEYFAKLEKRMAPLEILREANPVWYNNILKK